MRLNLRGKIKRLIYQAILSIKLYAAQIFCAGSMGSLHPHLVLTLYFRSGILNIVFMSLENTYTINLGKRLLEKSVVIL